MGDEPQHDRAVVGVAVGAVPGGGVEHLPPHPRPPHAARRSRPHDRDAARRQPAEQPLPLDRRLVQRPDLDLADLPASQQAGHALDVVGVQVGQHQQRDPPDAQPRQAGVDLRRVGAGVDDQSRRRPEVDDETVALPHVAADKDPARWRPRRPDHHDSDRGRSRTRPRRRPQALRSRGDRSTTAPSRDHGHREHAAPAQPARQRSPRAGLTRAGVGHDAPASAWGARRPATLPPAPTAGRPVRAARPAPRAPSPAPPPGRRAGWPAPRAARPGRRSRRRPDRTRSARRPAPRARRPARPAAAGPAARARPGR